MTVPREHGWLDWIPGLSRKSEDVKVVNGAKLVNGDKVVRGGVEVGYMRIYEFNTKTVEEFRRV